MANNVIKETSKEATWATSYNLMSAKEARRELNRTVDNLALKEASKAIEKVKDSIAKGNNRSVFSFDSAISAEVFVATISMLRDLGYEIECSTNYTDTIYITVE